MRRIRGHGERESRWWTLGGVEVLDVMGAVHRLLDDGQVVHIGTDAQKQQWLPKMISGEAVGAIGMTEPGAGSDLAALRTSAIKDGDEYVINGSKVFITNGSQADIVIVAAKGV